MLPALRQILVYVDTLTAGPAGDQALLRASRIALASGARLTVADVAPEIPAYVQRLLPGGPRISQLLREERLERLERLTRRLRKAGTPTELLLLEGTPTVAIAQEVQRAGHDLVAVTRSAERPESGALAHHLVRKAGCPVWVVREPVAAARARAGRRRTRVLAAVDVTGAADVMALGFDGAGPADEAAAALAAKILRTAAELADLQGAELHVLHAWVAYGESMLRGRALGGISQADARRYVAAVAARAREALQAAVAPLGTRVPAGRVHLVKGYPDTVIPAFAAARAIDTVVMGTVARSGLAGLLVGNTAERVLDAAPCSVLAVKPDGFVSPIGRPPGEASAGVAAGASGSAGTVAGTRGGARGETGRRAAVMRHS